MQQIMSYIPMKRIVVPILAFLGVAVLFGGAVHTVLVAAKVAEPAATTVYGMTDKRLWATAAFVLALIAVAGGGLGLFRRNSRSHSGSRRFEVITALVGGLIAMINGWLILLTANGGPNSGNGVVGGAMALVLGLVGIFTGTVALVRSRRTL